LVLVEVESTVEEEEEEVEEGLLLRSMIRILLLYSSMHEPRAMRKRLDMSVRWFQAIAKISQSVS